MAIVGFGFTRMSVERKGDIKGKIQINNHVSIKEVDTIDLSLGKAKQKGLKVDFEFKSMYEPKVAEIVFEGNVLDIEEEKTVDEVIKGWKKNKKLPDNIMDPIINSILSKCNVQALIMSRDINLPPPIPLPKVSRGPSPAEQKK